MKQKKNTQKAEIKTDSEMNTDNIAEPNAQSATEQDQIPPTPKLYSETEYQLKVNELNDKYLRLYSEFDNFRKRTMKEKIDLRQTASEDLIKDLLPVLDDFDRAMASMTSTDNIEAIIEGEKLIQAKMRTILASKGLQEIKSIGETFDTDFHEAVTSIPAPSKDLKNKVVDEIQKGYMLHDKVIRFSKVITGS